MSKEVSGCCEAGVIREYGTTICTECDYFPCSVKEVSECCETDIEVTIPAITGYMESPPDPIEHCSKCGREVE